MIYNFDWRNVSSQYLGIRTHRPEGFLEKLIEPLKPSGRFPLFFEKIPFIFT